MSAPSIFRRRSYWPAWLALLLCCGLCRCSQAPDPAYQQAADLAATYQVYFSVQGPGGSHKAVAIADSAVDYPPARALLRQSLLAHHFKTKGLPDSANLYVDSAIAQLEQPRLSHYFHGWMVNLYIARAIHFYNKGQYKTTLAGLAQAQQLTTQHHNKAAQNAIDYYLGMVAYQEQHYRRAADLFKACYATVALAHSDPVLQTMLEAELLDNIGLCYQKLGMHEPAEQYFFKALNYIESRRLQFDNQPARSLGRYHNHLANVLENLGNAGQAKDLTGLGNKYFSTALKHAHSSIETDSLLIARLHTKQAMVLMPLGRQALADGQLDSAARFAPTGNPDALQALRLRATVVQLLHKGRAAESLASLQRLDSLDKQMVLRKTLNMQAEIESTLRTEQQQATIEQMRQYQTTQQRQFWAMALAMAMIVGASLVGFVQYRRNQKLLRSEKALHRQVKTQKQALEMAALEKEKLMRVVAHDLRTPVGGIASGLELMQPELALNEANGQLYRLLIDSAQQCLQLINEMVGQASMNNSANSPALELKDLVNNCVLLMGPKAVAKGIELLAQVPAAPLKVRGTALGLNRVLDNLVHNAIKFSHSGQPVTVRAMAAPPYALLQVVDRGVGMTEEQMALLFRGQGTPGTEGEASYGLGLNICRQLVEQMDGQLTVESRLGEGTVMTVKLPLVA